MILKWSVRNRGNCFVIEPQVKSSCWEYREGGFRQVGIISFTSIDSYSLHIGFLCVCVCDITPSLLCSLEINLKLIRHSSYSNLGKIIKILFSKTSQDESIGWKWTVLLCFYGEIKNNVFFPCGVWAGKNKCYLYLVCQSEFLVAVKNN